MKKQILVLMVAFFVFAQPCFAEKNALEVSGSISKVIVYRGQALVTRTIEIDLPKGTSELIVQKLPNRIVSETLYAQGSDDVTITSVRYREKAIKEDTREEVKKLDAEIEQLQTRLRHAKDDHKLLRTNTGTLDKLRDFTVAAQSSDLNRGVLQFEPLEQLVGFIETKRGEYHEQRKKLDDEIGELKKQLELLERRMGQLKAGRSRTERQAVLFVTSAGSKKAVIELSYLVNKANWMPQYNLRAQPDKSEVTVEYNSIIHQASGEDWTGVSLSLSTAQPTMEAAPPVLDPMKVGVVSGKPTRRRKSLHESEQVGVKLDSRAPAQYRDLSDEFRGVQNLRREMARKGKAAQAQLNVFASSNQMMELQADKKDVQVIKKEAKRFARTEGVSVTYELGDGLSMPSRSDQQLITIAAFQAKAEFIMIATPMLTDYVYLQADIVNNSDVILLAAPVSMYRNGEFVGKGGIEMVTIGEKFTAGFGVDSQIQISREFKDKKVDSLWGNRIENYEYRIAIDNYKSRPVRLRLLERIPYTEDEELVIEEFKTNTPLSKDAEYLRAEKDKGILRWDLDLAPVTTEKKATIITYGYTMKYDNDMHIRSVPSRN